MPCVCSPGSNQTGAMVKCTAQVIWPSGAAYAGAAASAGARARAATARRPATRRFMVVSPLAASVQDAHADLNDVAKALGASTVKSIQYTGNGGVYAVGQSAVPG